MERGGFGRLFCWCDKLIAAQLFGGAPDGARAGVMSDQPTGALTRCVACTFSGKTRKRRNALPTRLPLMR
jgi:hypothetical protein